tara:strand:+ start:2454 stop:3122 length:669 start_codon:yes stop_codon:yes gene_type:complete
MSKLILIPTPIGNLGDITLRAIEIIKAVDVILAEDTRHTGKLLKYLNIQKTMRSYHAHNEHKSVVPIIDEIKSGEVFGLVSDAGTPGISDPGFLLVRECISAGIQVEALPGPTAFVPALVASGLPCDKFYFEGFLPHKKGRQTRFNFLANLPCAVILYESPHRLLKTLKQMGEFIGENRRVCIVRELSKLHETFHRGKLKDQIEFFQKTPPKGEIIIILEGI